MWQSISKNMSGQKIPRDTGIFCNDKRSIYQEDIYMHLITELKNAWNKNWKKQRHHYSEGFLIPFSKQSIKKLKKKDIKDMEDSINNAINHLGLIVTKHSSQQLENVLFSSIYEQKKLLLEKKSLISVTQEVFTTFAL